MRNAISLLLAGLLLFAWTRSHGQPAVPTTEQQRIENLIGTWEIDLRPSPDAPAYIKEFTVAGLSADSLRGVFYGTRFTNGRVNANWDKLYFAFTTADGSGTYYTSGYLSEGKLSGMTYAQGRGFIMPWFSVRKK
ncbi:hypothetical protein GCM10027341_32890 [Spirosoma knui]